MANLILVKLSKKGPYASPDWIAHPLRHGKLLRDKDMSFSDFNTLAVVHSSGRTNVFLCRHKGTKLCYALKGVKKVSMFQKQKAELLKREIEMHLSLSKWAPNVFRVFDHHSYVFLVMEYCVCADLHTLWRKARRLPSEVLKYYTIQVIAALNYLHGARRIVYRNLEASNVLIAASGQVKLTGFSNAVILGTEDEILTEDGDVLARAETIAPELIPPSVMSAFFQDAEERYHSIEVDYWALGVMLFKLISGVSPHKTVNGIDAPTLWNNIRTGERRTFPIYAKILYSREKLGEVIDGLLQIDLEKRWGYDQLESCAWLQDCMRLDPTKLVPPYRPKSLLLKGDTTCFRRQRVAEASPLEGDEEFRYCYFQDVVNKAMLDAATASPKPKKKGPKPDILEIKPVQDPETWAKEAGAAVSRKKAEILERRKRYKVLPEVLLDT